LTTLVSSATYIEFSASALLNNGTWLSTDRIVLKFYGSKVGSGSNPAFDFQFGGSTPVRTVMPVPASVIVDLPITIDSTSINNGTASTLLRNEGGKVGDTNYTVPKTDGTNGQTLITDGAGAATWQTPVSNPEDFIGELQLSATNTGDKYYQLFNNNSAVYNSNAQAATVRFIPFYIPKDTTFTNIIVRIAANVASAKLRIGIFSNQNNYNNGGVTHNIFPDAPLADTGDLNAATAGIINTAVTSFALTKNTIYWLAIVGTNSPQFVNMPAASIRIPFVNADPAGTASIIGTAGTATPIFLGSAGSVGSATAFASIASGYPVGGISTARFSGIQTVPVIILGY